MDTAVQNFHSGHMSLCVCYPVSGCGTLPRIRLALPFETTALIAALRKCLDNVLCQVAGNPMSALELDEGDRKTMDLVQVLAGDVARRQVVDSEAYK